VWAYIGLMLVAAGVGFYNRSSGVHHRLIDYQEVRTGSRDDATGTRLLVCAQSWAGAGGRRGRLCTAAIGYVTARHWCRRSLYARAFTPFPRWVPGLSYLGVFLVLLLPIRSPKSA
jgi:hypothetical protein